jgi:hypothetical protein
VWGIDYNQFYAGSRLAGTGHLYDWEALRTIEVEHGPEVPTGRLPVVLYPHKILSIFPYAVARSIWMGCSIAAFIVLTAWPGAQPLFMTVGLAWATPAIFVLLLGQDVPFWLMFFTAGLLLIQRRRPWSAGAAFALCICKFHLGLGIPVMLASQKRWRTLIAGAIAISALVAACFLIEGVEWPVRYLKMSHLPEFSPGPQRMPTLYGIASQFRWPLVIEVLLAGVVMSLLWAACRGSSDLGMTGAAAAACGLLLGHHAYVGDCTLLIPLSVLTMQREGVPLWLKAWAVLELTPVPALLLASRTPLVGQISIAIFVISAVLVGKERPLSRVDQTSAQVRSSP